MDYKIPLLLTHEAENGYTVTSPLLPELLTEGDSIVEALDNIKDALTAVIETHQDIGWPLPKIGCLPQRQRQAVRALDTTPAPI